MVSLTINGKIFDTDVEPDTPLLWAIRENVGLTGTKYGCGIAQCGACTVHIDGVAIRSCGVLVSEAVGQQITTIEGLATDGVLTKVQQAWIANDVPVRILPERHDHGCRGTAQGEAEADRRGYRRGHYRYLPVRYFPAGARGDPRRRERMRGAP
jgi:hypothetical protein